MSALWIAPIHGRMEIPNELTLPVHRLLTRLADGPLQDSIILGKSLNGGSEASDVTLVTARYRGRTGSPKTLRFIVKQLAGRPAREAAIYERLVAAHADRLAPRLLAVERSGPDTVFLFIEAIRRSSSWPWRDPAAGEELLVRLAQFHADAEDADAALPEWDYEAELAAMAESTRTALDQCRGDPDLSVLARDLTSLNQIILALPKLRSQLLAERPFGRRPIHGDVHPGNVLVGRRGQGKEPVLLDWGRARPGSPLEDVSSWLQSMGYWEPVGRRYHDTLLMSYLSAFGMERTLTPSVRAAYWMAGASNALSGALLTHLLTAQDRRNSSSRRAAAFAAAQDALRIVRRARAWWG